MRRELDSHRIGWDTNMAAVSLFGDRNMAAVILFQKTLKT